MSDPNATLGKKRVSLFLEERLLLINCLMRFLAKDAEAVKRTARIAKALEVALPDARRGRHTVEPMHAWERTACGFEVVEVPIAGRKDEFNHAPKIKPEKDRAREFKLMPLDHGMIVDEIDSFPVPTSQPWLNILDAFAVGELTDVDTEPSEPSAPPAEAAEPSPDGRGQGEGSPANEDGPASRTAGVSPAPEVVA